MSKTIGPYRLNPRGDYNPASDPLYSLLDLVSDGGGSFVYINDTPSNEPTSSTSHWQQVAEKGDPGGPPGPEGPQGPEGAPGSIATDAIWNAVGDLPIGAGENAATILPKGGIGQILKSAIAGLEWDVENKGVFVNVKDYGAIGDGITDDTAAIQAAADATPSSGVLFFPPALNFATSGTITIPRDIDVIMESQITYSGDATAIAIGETDLNAWGRRYKISVIRASQSDWTSELSIGVKINNATQCNIEIVNAEGFTIGVQCIGDDGGFVYNTVHLYGLRNNKISVDCTNKNVGWCNENLFIGGRFAQVSTVNPSKSRYGVRITSQDDGYVVNNNNVFLKPSFELYDSALTGGAEAVPVLIEHGEKNSFYYIRNENNSSVTMRVLDGSYNYLESGFGLVNLDDQSLDRTNVVRSFSSFLSDDAKYLVFKADSIHRSACYYDGASTIYVPGLAFIGSSSGTIGKSSSSHAINSDYLSVSHGLGRFIRTRRNKRFLVTIDADAGYGGRVRVQCYDSSGNILTSAGANHPYAIGIPARQLIYGSTYGGTYATGSDSDAPCFFIVGADVAYIFLAITKGTNNARLRSFSVFAENDCASWLPYEEIIPGANIGTAAPTAGTWGLGRRVINDAPATGQPKAWICTTAGTPGTWKSEGNL